MRLRWLVWALLAVAGLLIGTLLARGQEEEKPKPPVLACTGALYQEKDYTGEMATVFEVQKCASDKLGVVCDLRLPDKSPKKAYRLLCRKI
ncbi:MAG: hypothetical protein ACREJ8_09105, partial [Candidatus Methylomirabilales bacterium]